MKLRSKILAMAMLCATAISANAAGTASGTTINNTASLNYSVGGVSQPGLSSNTVSFVVDTRVNMTLVADNGGVPTNTIPGGTGYVHKFLLTNTGNSVQDFILTRNSTGFGGSTLYTRTDNFDATGCVVRVDGNNNGIYESAIDTRLFVDELAADASIAIFTICDVPSGRVNGDFSIVSLSAQIAAGGTANTQGAALTATAGADNPSTVDIVFGDAAGSDDAAKDGLISARGGYLVVTANVTVNKTSSVICDPVNFNSNPKAIPGAYIRYTITVTNAAGAGASATLGTLTDSLSSGLTFDNDLIVGAAASCTTPESSAGNGFKISCTGGTRACVATPAYKTTAADADGIGHAAGVITSNFATALGVEPGYTAGELKAGESVTLTFNVRLN